MKTKVLVVDDSSFFRRRVSEIINADPDMEVIDIAKNGEEAITKTKALRPDVITMDIEMPVLDGISAVKAIMASTPTPILMFSSLTHQGAKATLDALEAGAANFLPKKFEDIAKDKAEAVKLLQQNIKAISRRGMPLRHRRPADVRPTATVAATARTTAEPIRARSAAPERSSLSQRAGLNRGTQTSPSAPTTPAPAASARVSHRASGKKYDLLAIGSSTGGPVALQGILTKLGRNFPLPIVLIQHMPATFTAAFAARLDSLCQISVKEAEHGDLLRPGCAYLAPGGKQVLIESKGAGHSLKVVDSPAGINYKPSVDITLGSASQHYRDKVLAVILTGMGADGRDGAKLLKQKGSKIWAQDAESCVVYGMPQAVVNAGIADEQVELNQIADRIITEVGCK